MTNHQRGGTMHQKQCLQAPPRPTRFARGFTLRLLLRFAAGFTLRSPNFFRPCMEPVCRLRNRKHVPCFYRETRVEVWENEKCCRNTSRRRVFPQLFRVLPNFQECFCNSIETRSTRFLFLLENMKKWKTTC